MHPEVLNRLRDEILTVVGPERRPTYDDLREMKYLRAVINGDYDFFRIVALQGSDSVQFTRCRGIEALSPGVSHRLLAVRASVNHVMLFSPFDSRATINATTLSNKTPGAKPWYVPARTRYGFRTMSLYFILTIGLDV